MWSASSTDSAWVLALWLSSLLRTVLSLADVQALLSEGKIGGPSLTFAQTWQVLGPFRIGTREAVWGADPLEVVGGFANLSYDASASFRSSLTANATIHWTTRSYGVNNSEEESAVQFDVSFSNVNWTFQQQVYGWAALQYQAWARGILYNNASVTTSAWVYPDNILEFRVNDEPFFGGDFFGFKRAPALVHLQPGENVFDIRLVRDVRAMGGGNPPTIEVTLRVRQAPDDIEVDVTSSIVPNVVEGKFPSHYFSMPVRNTLSKWIEMHVCPEHDSELWSFVQDHSYNIAPGQIRPLDFRLGASWSRHSDISGVLCYTVQGDSGQRRQGQVGFRLPLQDRNLTETSKFTFLHPSGTVSYAMLKPPAKLIRHQEVPLLLFLHGAGVEADSDDVRHYFDGMPDLEAFTIFPAGMSPWSGDDWHLWGAADTLQAVEAVQSWISTMNWNGTQPTGDRVVLAGHSNGGQGVWYFATHHPDRVIAAAPLSGYTSIENYVSYHMWMETDPLKSSIVSNARSNFRHELLLANLERIPVLQQHGSIDDNVPTYNSRLMSELRAGLNMPSDYYEVPEKSHWWDGVVTTRPLQAFYRQYLVSENTAAVPVGNFTMVVPGSGLVESKFGLVVDQLKSPDQAGYIRLEVSDEEESRQLRLETNNIQRLHFRSVERWGTQSLSISIDGNPQPVLTSYPNQSQISCSLTLDKCWECSSKPWMQLSQRYGRQRGALDALLRSEGAFQIVSCTESLDLAIQSSRNLYQYYGAASDIISCEHYMEALSAQGNMILFSDEARLIPPQLPTFPIQIKDGNVILQSPTGEQQKIQGRPGLGAIFIRPLPDERIELIVWGWDAQGLRQAARLVPTVTGIGQPDFVVTGSKTGSHGVAGVLAMGFFDYQWKISKASYLP